MLVRSRESKPWPPALQAKLILPRSKGERGALLYFAYVFVHCPMQAWKTGGCSSLFPGPIREWMEEAWKLGTERTVARVPGEFFQQPWQVTSHKSHIIRFQPFGVLPPPPPPPPYTLSHFLSVLIIKAKQINLIFSWLWLVGVYNLIPRSCHQFDQEVFIYNT